MKKTTAFGIVSILLLASITITFTTSVKATIEDAIYVDDDADPSWYNATHVKTIQEGINNASDDDIVFVYNGTYVENIVINKPLKLMAQNKESTMILGNGSDDVVSIISDLVSISSFTIDAGTKESGAEIACIYLESSSCTIANNSLFKGGLKVNSSFNNIVENNTVNAKALVYLEDVSDEIVTNAGQVILVKCINITIKDLDLSNAGIGIQLVETIDSIIHDNILSNNIYGMLLDELCDNNTIYHNEFIGNLVNAFDAGSNNWDDGAEGNYWDDYTGVDADGNGIGDTPYIIAGNNNQDRFPLVQDSVLPTVVITKPEKALYYNSNKIIKFFMPIVIKDIDITVDATDASGIQKVVFYIDDEKQAEDTVSPYNWTWEKLTGLQIQKIKRNIKVIAYDNAGNTNSTNITVWRLKHPLLTMATIAGATIIISKLLEGDPGNGTEGDPPEEEPEEPEIPEEPKIPEELEIVTYNNKSDDDDITPIILVIGVVVILGVISIYLLRKKKLL